MPTEVLSRGDYIRDDHGLYVAPTPVTHRDDEYDPEGFNGLLNMQSRHFWYLGRHRFLLNAVRAEWAPDRIDSAGGCAVDLGGGCGGWIQYLEQRGAGLFAELALADSSKYALEAAGDVVSANVSRYQIDLLQLHWSDRWDVAFLLDVIEHIPDHAEAMRQIHEALAPGGLLFVTAPAFKCFWSYNDTLAKHVRRYNANDLRALARETGFEVQRIRYFMLFLSPLLLLSRIRAPDVANMSSEQIRQLLERTHRVPLGPINQILRFIFSLETPLGLWVPFPFGTSVLAVLRKPPLGTP